MAKLSAGPTALHSVGTLANYAREANLGVGERKRAFYGGRASILTITFTIVLTIIRTDHATDFSSLG